MAKGLPIVGRPFVFCDGALSGELIRGGGVVDDAALSFCIRVHGAGDVSGPLDKCAV